MVYYRMGNMASSEAERDTMKQLFAYKKALVELQNKVQIYKNETEHQKDLILRLKSSLDSFHNFHSKQMREKETQLDTLRGGCEQALSFLKELIETPLVDQTVDDLGPRDPEDGFAECDAAHTSSVNDLIDIEAPEAKLEGSSYESFI